MVIASRKFAGNLAKGISVRKSAKFSFVNRDEMIPTQQWLSATYLSSISLDRTIRGLRDSVVPTSFTRESGGVVSKILHDYKVDDFCSFRGISVSKESIQVHCDQGYLFDSNKL
jgi:hypothetical protein